ncbi:MAG: diacylglycerol kinase [Sphingobacteriales bacterium 17-39-43]|uniref:diacylglycerol kinase n=1 Tax=Daejeonella sp. TaxID=2805397 RepID=UPI000BD464CA|nr:diacylglycerol kinase family protein [Daejeonella sp.]MCF8452809.1 diacylglycerol kinase family protein [Pedobacter sp.]OYY05657.1 MAG: diacylglycerol kinase [Sphingobacteriia bacterium 35-40-5]OYZ31119.1 MAG: diacylglycerol kinase [Sphingobacteriales bacterium 16-39-50]OZA23960.1 MAG: diacylglycerol kinase [Sphingobacteriales bacterium 17-39-43]OZA55586.1 MAG: diacylglycerol kinase [Sphingobacteriales bacterium 39-40-5]
MKKFFRGFVFAFNGIKYTFKTQLNFRVHCFVAIVLVGLCFYLELNKAEWLWIITAMAIVLMAELANTAVETLVDLVSPEYNIKAGRIKDIAAALVLIAAVTALSIGILILLPKVNHAS